MESHQNHLSSAKACSSEGAGACSDGRMRPGLGMANRTAFLVMGCIEASWAPLVPYVKEAYHLDEGQLGMLLLCSGVGAVAGLPVAGSLCMKQGARRTVIGSGILLATSILLLSLFLGLWATALFLIMFGICTTIIDVSANVNGVAVEKKTDRHLMSGFHGGYSLGALLVTLGFASTALIPNVLGTVVGFALVGIGAANIVSQLVSFAGGIQGMAIEKTISVVNALGYSAILLAPVIIGFLAKHYGLPIAFFCIAASCLVVAALTSWIMKEKR